MNNKYKADNPRNPINIKTVRGGIKIAMITMQKETFNELGPMMHLLTWMERHHKLANAILWIEAIALAWAVFTYDFTTNF